MAQHSGNLHGHRPSSQMPPATYAWALSAFALGVLYGLLSGLISVVLFVTMFWFFLIFTVPPLLLSAGFIFGGSGLLSGRQEARSLLKTCAGIAAIGNFIIVACCTGSVAINYPTQPVLDYRVVVMLLVSVAQVLYCVG